MIAPAVEGALVSFTTCIVLTPIVRALCVRRHILDFPGPLKIHPRPVPRLGGIALALSIAAGILISARDAPGATLSFFAALGVVWLAGVADDLRSVSPYARIAAQIVSGVLLWLGGWRFAAGHFLPTAGPISLVSVCGLAILLINGFNFLDGSDGLAAGVAAIVGIALLAISRGAAHDLLTVPVAACLAGSCCAFLFYNFAPATIHLGDSGSTVLGFCVAFLALCRPLGTDRVPSLAIATLLISALPIADFALAVFRRLRSRASLLQGDRSHLYDRMLAQGYSPRAVALLFCAITIALAVAGWLCLRLGVLGRMVILALSLAGLLTFAIWLGALPGGDRGIQPDRSGKFAAPKETGSPF